ncbi:MAG TPA: hypothetical protein VJB90_03020 [Candidatus Nanoarchaeia archaeon]|nr:hypothetical protein [Candidatus Nanoarchaeia archaeon]
MKSSTNGILPGIVLIGVVVLGALFLFGGFDITGLAAASASTSTVISSPATGAEIKSGESFTVTAVIGCRNSKCNTVRSTISFPAGGLVLKTGSATKTWTSLSPGSSQTVSWLIQANQTGNRQVKVSTTSKNAQASSNLISVIIYVPACSSNADCGPSQYVTSAYCGEGGDVFRDYQSLMCAYPGTFSSSCQSSVTSVKVADCGNNGFVGQPYCLGLSVYQKYLSVGCSSGQCTNSTSDVLLQECLNGCSNGACNPEPALDSCGDSDGGFNTYQQGTVSGNSNGQAYSLTDTCFNGTASLTEYYCVGDQATSITNNCYNVNGSLSYCYNGRCY